MKNLARHPRAFPRGFTMVELMTSLIIFALVITAASFLLASTARTRNYVQNGVTSSSEVEFAMQRMIENIRSANAVTVSFASGVTTITITSPPSPLISNNTFTITYSGPSGGAITETFVNNSNSSTYSSGTLVHNVTTFTAGYIAGSTKAWQITITTSSGTSRTFDAFGRNL